jgi:hypothetical protein
LTCTISKREQEDKEFVRARPACGTHKLISKVAGETRRMGVMEF